eukprot:COSAG01_NODE_11330_length_1956_cov_1.176629_2_plen_68_part_00
MSTSRPKLLATTAEECSAAALGKAQGLHRLPGACRRCQAIMARGVPRIRPGAIGTFAGAQMSGGATP